MSLAELCASRLQLGRKLGKVGSNPLLDGGTAFLDMLHLSLGLIADDRLLTRRFLSYARIVDTGSLFIGGRLVHTGVVMINAGDIELRCRRLRPTTGGPL